MVLKGNAQHHHVAVVAIPRGISHMPDVSEKMMPLRAVGDLYDPDIPIPGRLESGCQWRRKHRSASPGVLHRVMLASFITPSDASQVNRYESASLTCPVISLKHYDLLTFLCLYRYDFVCTFLRDSMSAAPVERCETPASLRDVRLRAPAAWLRQAQRTLGLPGVMRKIFAANARREGG
jgi:hypothetical protein